MRNFGFFWRLAAHLLFLSRAGIGSDPDPEFFTPLSDAQSATELRKPIEVEISKYLSENRLKEPTFVNENSKEVLMYWKK
uniref:Secreted protein n=1 Tax=Steinernema glaseri TaxID=37863 RepID=A0A1I7Y7X9_9BILA